MGSVHLFSSSDYSFYPSVFLFYTSFSPSSQSAVTLYPSEKNYPHPVGQAPTRLLLKFLLNSCLGDNIFYLPSRPGALNVREQDKDVISYAKVMQGLCYL